MTVANGIPLRSIPAGTRLVRIFRTYFEDGLAPRWFFSDTSRSRPGRFDLAMPDGTCYLSDDVAGCWLEVFRAARVVLQSDVDARSVLIAVKSSTGSSVMDLTDGGAVASGISLDHSAGEDYEETQALAAEALADGADGIVSWIRHDPAARFRNFGIFATAGGRDESPGWTSTQEPLASHVDAVSSTIGFQVVGLPYDLPVSQPPKRHR